MTTRYAKDGTNLIAVTLPTREDIRNLKVGDRVPNCFGKEAEVVEIYALGTDIEGRAYVCYYTTFGEGSRISDSQKEGRIHRTLWLSNRFTSAQIDSFERQLGGK